jgi:2-amino-4-hydroxy-6-hydroxymethyldihydropteridine diphosphokinase
VNRTTTLKLPHPELEKRAFVLMPLKELSPNWKHPVSGLSIDVLLEQWKQISNEPLPEILDLDSI